LWLVFPAVGVKAVWDLSSMVTELTRVCLHLGFLYESRSSWLFCAVVSAKAVWGLSSALMASNRVEFLAICCHKILVEGTSVLLLLVSLKLGL
jgi:hypothetical protein